MFFYFKNFIFKNADFYHYSDIFWYFWRNVGAKIWNSVFSSLYIDHCISKDPLYINYSQFSGTKVLYGSGPGYFQILNTWCIYKIYDLFKYHTYIISHIKFENAKK